MFFIPLTPPTDVYVLPIFSYWPYCPCHIFFSVISLTYRSHLSSPSFISSPSPPSTPTPGPAPLRRAALLLFRACSRRMHAQPSLVAHPPSSPPLGPAPPRRPRFLPAYARAGLPGSLAAPLLSILHLASYSAVLCLPAAVTRLLPNVRMAQPLRQELTAGAT